MPQQQPPIGADVTALMPQIGEDVSSLMVSHQPEPAPAEHPHARTFRLAKANAPLIGGLIGAGITGGASLPVQALAAGAGGAIGGGVRGDGMAGALMQGAKEGATQLIGGGLVKAGGAVARGLMKGTVPKNIAKDFQGQVDIPREMLDRGVFPGSARSAKRVEGLSTAANAERDAAAATVPNLSRSKVIAGLRPMHAKGVSGKVPEMSEATLEQMRKSAREIGSEGLDGPGALARKDIKQAQGSAALNSSDPRSAAFGSQLADAERGAIVSHLRDTPRMAKALDESQALMAIDQVMKDAALSNLVTRARIGGVAAASMSPIGLGATAHAVNQGRHVLEPQLLRAIQIAMLRDDQ